MAEAGEPRIYDFGAFRLDAGERLLLRGRDPVPLTPKAFDLLLYLVEHPGRLVEKSTLLSAVWPETIVEEANLAFQVSALRKILDSDGDSLIQTVPTRGYRFIGRVTRAIPVPSSTAPPPLRPALAGPPRSRRRTSAIVGVVLLGGAGLYLVRSVVPVRPASVATPAPSARLVSLTTMPGWQGSPSLSPDGEQVAFVWRGERDDNTDIYVTLVGTTDVRRMTTSAGIDRSPAWSPSGRDIAFVREENGAARIHVMSSVGGSDRAVSEFPELGQISWSPDGRFIVGGRQANGAERRGIYLVPLSSGEPSPMVSLQPPAIAQAPAFSPNGRQLAYVRCDRIDSEALSQGCQLMLLDLDANYAPTSAPRQLTSEPMSNVDTVSWTRDGSSIVLSGSVTRPTDRAGGPSDDGLDHVWRVRLGTPPAVERVEMAGPNAVAPTTTSGRDRLVFTRFDWDLDIVRSAAGRPPERIISSIYFDAHPSFSPDGRRIVFCSDRSGTLEIWVAEADGTSPRQVTRGPNASQGSPRFSPDGSLIAFDSLGPDGNRHIWTIPAGGGAAKQVTFDAGEQAAPTWSGDGQWIYFSQRVAGKREIWRVHASGGSPTQISHGRSGVMAFESPDGRSVVHTGGETDTRLMQTPIAGGNAKQLASCTAGERFSVVGGTIYYQACGAEGDVPIHAIDGGGHDRLWAVPPGLKAEWSWDPAISPDGTTIVYNKVMNVRANLWLIDNFR